MNLANASNITIGSTTVSAVYLGNTLIWSRTPQHDYSLDYLTFEALEPTTFTFSTNALQYSLDDGSTWTTLAANTASPTVNAGAKIRWKQTGLTISLSYGLGKFLATGNFKVYGNIMSLYYGDNFIGQTSLSGKDRIFYELFSGNNKLIDASNLILPATTLAEECYCQMFYNCHSLTSGPKILPATRLSRSCYYRMFYDCTSLITAPELPATTLANYCYEYMFGLCASLTTAPELPATTLSDYCYQYMFVHCTSLTTPPELPATTLTKYCYNNMFYDCTSLTTAPELPATTLTERCYYNMFYGCSSLNYVKCLATDISASNCTAYWVNNVAASGTFVRHASMTDWTIGTSGIPSGWSVVPPYSENYLTFIPTESSSFSFSTNDLQYSLDDGSTWTTLTAGSSTPAINTGNKIIWKQTGLTPTSNVGIGTFSATGNFKAYGNVMSLYYGDNFVGETDLTGKDYAFYQLFYQNTKLTDVVNLILPATTLSTYCYCNMFRGCTSFTTAPQLPATTLSESCYRSMFNSCSSLTTAPELPATTLQRYCYYYMFENCTSLTAAPDLPALGHVGYAYNGMFRSCSSLNYIKCMISPAGTSSGWVQNVASTGTFVKNSTATNWTTGNSGIPYGWTVQNA